MKYLPILLLFALGCTEQELEKDQLKQVFCGGHEGLVCEVVPVPKSPTQAIDITEGIPRDFTIEEGPVHLALDFFNDQDKDLHVYWVGTKPDGLDVQGYQAFYGRSPNPAPNRLIYERGFEEQLYFNVATYNQVSQQWGQTVTKPFQFKQQTLGRNSNRLTFTTEGQGYGLNNTIVDGWSEAQGAKLKRFCNRMATIMNEVIGPPALSNTVRIRYNAVMTGMNVYLAGQNEIQQAWDPLTEFPAQLLTHEMAHAYEDHTTAGTIKGNYTATLAPITEGLAEAEAIISVNRYHEVYGADEFIKGPTKPYLSHLHDFLNVPELRSPDNWSSQGGLPTTYQRYQRQAQSWLKCYSEDPQFFQKVRKLHYFVQNANGGDSPDFKTWVDMIASIRPTVEGLPFRTWIQTQHALIPEIVEGPKTFIGFNFFKGAQNITIFDTYHYSTFPNGSDWYYEGEFHSLNGQRGTIDIYNHQGELKFSDKFQLLPIENPPVENRFANMKAGTSTNYGNGYNYINNFSGAKFDIDSTSLYKFVFKINDVETVKYVPQGMEIDYQGGILGAIPNSFGGKVFLEHEFKKEMEEIAVVNGVFHSPTRYPTGCLKITYLSQNGLAYSSQKNLNEPDNNGAQVILVDLGLMELVDPCLVRELNSSE